MKTRDEIRTEFQTVANGAELSGKVVDATIELLTEFKYSTLYEVASLNLESSSARCVLVNSAITHARELMYCVPRGINQRILIKNVIPTATFSVEQYQVAHTVSGKNLLYARKYNFTDGTTCDVEFIICNKKPVVVSQEVTSRNRYCVDFLDKDISSSIQLFWNSQDEETPLTTNFQHSLIEGTEELFQLTGIDYSVSIVNSQKKTMIDNNGNAKDYCGFLVGDTLTLKYVPFYNERLDPKVIKQVPRFLFNSDTVVTESQVIIEPESDVNKIWLDSCSAFTSGFVTRSNTDVSYLIKSYFNSVRPVIAGLNVITTMQGIYAYYTLPEPDAPAITEGEIAAFQAWISKAYYISQPIEFHPAEVYQISRDLPIIKIKISMEVSIDVSVFSEIAKEYCLNHIGVAFNTFELLAEFQKIKGVNFSSIIEISDGMEYLVNLEDNKYVSPSSILLVI